MHVLVYHAVLLENLHPDKIWIKSWSRACRCDMRGTVPTNSSSNVSCQHMLCLAIAFSANATSWIGLIVRLPNIQPLYVESAVTASMQVRHLLVQLRACPLRRHLMASTQKCQTSKQVSTILSSVNMCTPYGISMLLWHRQPNSAVVAAHSIPQHKAILHGANQMKCTTWDIQRLHVYASATRQIMCTPGLKQEPTVVTYVTCNICMHACAWSQGCLWLAKTSWTHLQIWCNTTVVTCCYHDIL